jgi:hypothetical protein
LVLADSFACGISEDAGNIWPDVLGLRVAMKNIATLIEDDIVLAKGTRWNMSFCHSQDRQETY